MAPPNTRFATRSGILIFPSSVLSSMVDVHAVAGARPNPPRFVAAQAVEEASGALREDLPAAQLLTAIHAELPDVARAILQARAAAVGDIQPLLVWRECQSVWTNEVIGNDLAVAGLRIDAIDVAAADFALGLVAFVMTVDSV